MDPKSRSEFETHLRNAHVLIKKLRSIVVDKLQTIENEGLNKKNYESPSWPYLQADKIGEVRGLQYILQLTDFMF